MAAASTSSSSRLAFRHQQQLAPYSGSHPQTPGSVSFLSGSHSLSFKSLETTRRSQFSRISVTVKAESRSEERQLDISLSPRVNAVKPSKTVAITC